MRNKNMVYIFLFSIFISINYLNLISRHFSDFENALELRSTSGNPIYLSVFQHWTFDLISLFCDAIIIAISVGVVGYYFKSMMPYLAVFFGLLLRYFIALGLLLYGIMFSASTSFLDELSNIGFRISFLIILQILSTVCFSYWGFNYGKRIDYVDAKDTDLAYFGGLRKTTWLLLIIAFNPVASFLSQLTIVQIYEFTKRIVSMSFWKDTFSLGNIFSEDSARGIGGLLGLILSIVFAWAIATALFSFGLNAIKNKKKKYRWLIISSIFILLPVIVLVIPLIRNRTWFF